mmetsp:Transcript_9107/g.25447  ORF Transcript_9107/g.25447 Transcript_9107/m.25447 type:complete len:325 (-) Transcript_9107:136-1110(-)
MQGQRPHGEAYLSKPQLYGGFGGFSRNGQNFFIRSSRQRMDLVSVFQCLLLPWALFCFVYAVLSFELHHLRPSVAYGLCALGLLPVIVSGFLALRTVWQKFRPDLQIHEPKWFIFLFLTICVGWTLGVVLGNLNFRTNMHPYYNYMNLNEYRAVSPATTRGQQLMDAGRVQFTNVTGLDIRRSMGFRNLDVYCVAPISIKGAAGTLLPLATYDFWAVGLGCCSGSAADFHCGEFDNPNAHGGLRLLKDEQRDFFRLAVRQAESTYAIKANHPLFFYWTQDARAEMETFRDEGYKFYLIGMLVHFAWQLLSVVLAAAGFSKLGAY